MNDKHQVIVKKSVHPRNTAEHYRQQYSDINGAVYSMRKTIPMTLEMEDEIIGELRIEEL